MVHKSCEFCTPRYFVAGPSGRGESGSRASPQEVAASLREMTTRPPQTLDALRGIEGRVALAYFITWRSMPLRWKEINRRPIPEEWHGIGSRVPPNSKSNRNATHLLNAMLKYGLAVLESQVGWPWLALALLRQSATFMGGLAGSRPSCST